VEAGDDLLWALRGAGHGGFGVITRFTFRTCPAPPATAFDLRFPPEQAAELIAAWQAWAPDAPDAMAASLLITAAPDPAEPVDVKVFGAMLASEAETEAELARLPAEPDDVALRHGSYRDTKRFLAGEGGDEAPMALYSRSEFFERTLPADTIEALAAHLTADRRPGEARELDFSPWAGAYGRVAPGDTAFPHRTARFLLKHTAATAPGNEAAGEAPGDEAAGEAAEAAGEAAGAWATGSWALTRPHGTGGVYPNFPDPELEDPGRAYYGANLERLLEIKAAYDPGGAFRFP
jgi:FAD/FMN-containing dehydrogenase